MIQLAWDSDLTLNESRTHMLRPKRNEVVDWGVVIPLNIRAKELSTLRESNRVETVLEFCDIRNLLSDEIDLLVHVSVLRNFGGWIAKMNGAACNVRRWPCDPVLGPLRCAPNE